MENLAAILEQELEEAVEVKNKNSLHRYVLLLTGSLVKQDNYQSDIGEIKSDLKIMVESMNRGFDAMEKRFDDINKRFDDVNRRFEDVDKRFEDVNRRFEDVNKRFDENGKRTMTMFAYMNIILGVLVLITILFKFI